MKASAWTDTELLSSRQNSRVKEFFSAKSESHAQKTGRALCEGLRFCETAARAAGENRFIFSDDARGRECWEKFFRSEGRESDLGAAVRLPASLFDQLANTRQSQGVLMLKEISPLTAFCEADPRGGRFLLLEGISDPGNLGTMLRTAEALSFSAAILLGDCVWPYNGKALRASMGAGFVLPLYRLDHVAQWKERGRALPLLTADAHGRPLSRFIDDWRQRKEDGFALLLGNEAHGISGEARRLCDALIAIEMTGQAESYNVSAAMAILAYRLSYPD